jgi:hypothetical protein
MSKPACSAQRVARTKSSRTRSMSARVMARGTGLRSDQGMAGRARSAPVPAACMLVRPGSSGPRPRAARSSPCGPAWASWMAELRAELAVNEIDDPLPGVAVFGRRYMPAQPGVIRPSGGDVGHFGEDQPRPAHRAARPEVDQVEVADDRPRAEYMHMGETTTRLGRVMSRRVSGANMGGARIVRGPERPRPGQRTSARPPGRPWSRRRRFSWLTRWLRVSRL